MNPNNFYVPGVHFGSNSGSGEITLDATDTCNATISNDTISATRVVDTVFDGCNSVSGKKIMPEYFMDHLLKEKEDEVDAYIATLDPTTEYTMKDTEKDIRKVGVRAREMATDHAILDSEIRAMKNAIEIAGPTGIPSRRGMTAREHAEPQGGVIKAKKQNAAWRKKAEMAWTSPPGFEKPHPSKITPKNSKPWRPPTAKQVSPDRWMCNCGIGSGSFSVNISQCPHCGANNPINNSNITSWVCDCPGDRHHPLGRDFCPSCDVLREHGRPVNNKNDVIYVDNNSGYNSRAPFDYSKGLPGSKKTSKDKNNTLKSECRQLGKPCRVLYSLSRQSHFYNSEEDE